MLSLCSDEFGSIKGALELCVSQMENVLSSHQLPLNASIEAISQAYHVTEVFVQVYDYKLIYRYNFFSNSVYITGIRLYKKSTKNTFWDELLINQFRKN